MYKLHIIPRSETHTLVIYASGYEWTQLYLARLFFFPFSPFELYIYPINENEMHDVFFHAVMNSEESPIVSFN